MVKNPKSPAAVPQPVQAELMADVFEPNENDIIDDILRRVIAMAPGFSAALAAQVDKEARQQWGGDRPYISLRKGAGHSRRNAAIKRDYLAGEQIPFLERRYALSNTRIWEIIKS
jgi:Mor family transcriptional regulator